MGSRGSGNFENDAALDWVDGKFGNNRDLDLVEKTLAEGLTVTEAPLWDEFIVAAEIVALATLLLGGSCPDEF